MMPTETLLEEARQKGVTVTALKSDGLEDRLAAAEAYQKQLAKRRRNDADCVLL